MANKKISELSSRTPALSDLMLVGDPSSGYSYKCTITALSTIVETAIGGNYVTLATTQTISGAKTFSNILTLTSVANSPTAGSKFLILNASNVVNYRTAAEVLSDIGAQAAGSYVPTTRSLTINGTAYDLSADRTWSVGTVTSVAATAGTGISISGSPITSSGTLTITNTAPDQTVVLTAGTGISVTGTYPSFTIAATSSATISGSGTTNYIPKFTSSSAIGNSIVSESGGIVNVNGAFSTYGSITVNEDGVGTKVLTIRSNWAGVDPAINVTTNNPLLFMTNNSERMRLNASGNLGIGTSSPASLLHIEGSLPFLTIKGSGSGEYGLKILDATATLAGLTYSSATGEQRLNGGQSYVYQTFYSGGSERMRITSGGNVGIGTTSPDFLLDVVRTTTGTVATFGIEGQTINPRLRIDADESNNTITLNPNYSGATSPSLVFKTQETERMRITSAGNVGIGTSTPNSKLQIEGTGTGAWITINRTDAGTNIIDYTQSGTRLGYVGYIGNDLTLNNATASNTIFNTSGSERMRITSGGNLLVGTTTDIGDKMYVNGSIRIPSTYFFRYDGDVGLIGSATSIGGTASQLGIRAANDILFATNGANERMRITSGGSVGIGTTSPQNKLQVRNGTFGIYQTIGSAPSSLGGQIYLGDTNFDNASYYNSAPGIGAVYNSVNAVAGDLALYVYDGVAGSRKEVMRLINSGNVGIGTSSPAAKLQVSGGSIRLDDGQALEFGGSTNFILGDNTNNLFRFYTNNSERMRLTSTGELLINTTSDAGDYKLQVNGSTLATNYWTPVSASNGYYLLNYNTSNASSRNWRITNDVNTYGDFGVQVATTQGGSTYTNSLILTSTTAVFNGSIQTAAPSGGTAAPWKLGSRVATSVALDTSQYIQLDINGTLYYLATVTLS